MNVLITGAGRRLGYELAQFFMADGHHVIGSYRTHYPEVDGLKQAGADLTCLELTDVQAVNRWLDDVLSRYPSLNVVIHNASAFMATEENVDTELVNFEHYFRVHMQIPFLINERCIAPLKKASKQGSNIIHITDIFARRPSPKFRTYCATKAGLQNLNHSYARMLAPDIRVNAIEPGPLEFLPDHTPEDQSLVLNETPLQRMGGFTPVVKTVAYILANEYLTGAHIPVDGGRSL